MSVVRGRPPGLAGGMSGSIKRYWSSLRAWPDPKSPTQVRSAGVHIVASRQGKVPGAPSARHSSPVKLTSTPFQNGLSAACATPARPHEFFRLAASIVRVAPGREQNWKVITLLRILNDEPHRNGLQEI